jgi:hypothetical protein
MILVRFTGGLGNQMFQYALGTCLAVKNKTVLKTDSTFLLDRSQPHEIVTHRNLDLDIFKVTLSEATEEEIWRFNGRPYKYLPGKIYNKLKWELSSKKNLVVEKERNFHPEILLLPDNKCLVGAWQSEKYFKPVEKELREQFRFKVPLSGIAEELGRQILNSNSLCVNVRRGDYVTSPVYNKMLGALPKEYFQEAYQLLLAKCDIDNVYVFSDDQDWCKKNFSFSKPTTFVGEEYAGPRYSTKLHLMTLCKHFIIPNSSYGWWAAWLSVREEKKVVAPLQWYKDSSLNSVDIVPESWMKI